MIGFERSYLSFRDWRPLRMHVRPPLKPVPILFLQRGCFRCTVSRRQQATPASETRPMPSTGSAFVWVFSSDAIPSRASLSSATWSVYGKGHWDIVTLHRPTCFCCRFPHGCLPSPPSPDSTARMGDDCVTDVPARDPQCGSRVLQLPSPAPRQSRSALAKWAPFKSCL
jgi:hypothetical protein